MKELNEKILESFKNTVAVTNMEEEIIKKRKCKKRTISLVALLVVIFSGSCYSLKSSSVVCAKTIDFVVSEVQNKVKSIREYILVYENGEKREVYEIENGEQYEMLEVQERKVIDVHSTNTNECWYYVDEQEREN